MSTSYAKDLVEVLRRIAERGKKYAQQRDEKFIDLFVHMLDELQRLKQELEDENT